MMIKLEAAFLVANTQRGKSIIVEMAEANKIYIEKESVENIITSQSANHVKFKTSHINERNRSFGTHSQHEDKVPVQYKRLVKWIKFNKSLYEKIVLCKVIRFVPSILLKVYRRTNSIVFSKLMKS